MSNWIKFDADTRGRKNHVHQVVKQTTDQNRPTAWSISGARARVLHVARSAVAMTAHSVTYCVVVPNIRFTRYFTVQNGADQEDHLSSLLTYMHADNISLWVNRCSLELLLIVEDSCIIGLMNQAIILHKYVCKKVLAILCEYKLWLILQFQSHIGLPLAHVCRCRNDVSNWA